jgi:hypothetical protein
MVIWVADGWRSGGSVRKMLAPRSVAIDDGGDPAVELTHHDER